MGRQAPPAERLRHSATHPAASMSPQVLRLRHSREAASFNKGAAGNAVGRLAVCGVNRFGDRAVTPHANRFAGMSRASASGLALRVLLPSAPPRARA